ncbi:L-threonylcarbamoyladenylate synthase [Litoribrevibacter albus]|uniref:Threonylcarbamoyl-AMP synthase n=1 Tax=Litoribrevibacter albus TaxID=1473156 RepID=A0AA37W7R8_9GAMM|nr:L-threonylcarbamoyladenylate synthase [Litoribrevibacter albus]GLQ30776.1 threonylcarbamoyl-AMP synthase [Litoribrevibacter albus]
MSQFFQIHPENPQPRLIAQAAEILKQGGVVVYPTESGYALGCHLGDKKALERIRTIRRLDDKHNFTLMCKDLSDIATYARVDNDMYRLLKSHTPGPYTFILKATRDVPRRVLHPKRKTIGIRVSENLICHAMLMGFVEPVISTTLILPGDELPLTDPYDIRDTIGNQVDLIIDGGFCGFEPTTVVNLSDDEVQILREGAGDVTPFQ